VQSHGGVGHPRTPYRPRPGQYSYWRSKRPLEAPAVPSPGRSCGAATSTQLGPWRRTPLEVGKLTFPHHHEPIPSHAVTGQPRGAPDVPQHIVAKDDYWNRVGRMHFGLRLLVGRVKALRDSDATRVRPRGRARSCPSPVERPGVSGPQVSHGRAVPGLRPVAATVPEAGVGQVVRVWDGATSPWFGTPLPRLVSVRLVEH
jgi:hypothetical protein